ncbi:hypothetical protein FRC10_011349 [Ceratobasidium sp. 414]|nr:hypothetical protein FRC10_011349 [Ceratobasidium sp. 414]
MFVGPLLDCGLMISLTNEPPAIGPQTSGLDLINYCFLKDARRIDTERADLETSGDVAALENWECTQYEVMEDRYMISWGYEEKTERAIRERKEMVAAKAVPQLTLFASELDNIHHSVYVLWNTLVEHPKLLTESAWKALKPKLKKILDESENCNFTDGEAKTQRLCYASLLALLIANGGENGPFKAIATALGVDTMAASAPAASTNHMYERVLTPYPNLKDALKWSCLEEFTYESFSPHQTEQLFGQVTTIVATKVSEWIEKVTTELDQVAPAGTLGAKKGKNDIILTVKGSTEPSEALNPVTRRLLRADCVFKASQTHPLYGTLRLGSSYPVALPLFFPDLLVTRRDAAWDVEHFEPYPDAKRVAIALLKCLGMEDAAHAEMKVMGSRFVCGRCEGHKTRDWSGIIGHYLEEQRRQKYARARPPAAEIRRHDLGQHAGEPLVKIASAEDAGETPDLGVFVPAKQHTLGIRGFRVDFG